MFCKEVQEIDLLKMPVQIPPRSKRNTATHYYFKNVISAVLDKKVPSMVC